MSELRKAMNNQDMQEQFKAEIIKNDYFLRVCKIKGIEPHEILSLHTDGQFKYSDVRLAYGAWLTKAFELQKKEKRIEKATAKWVSIASILTTVDMDIPDAIFKQLDQLHDALCGMDEIRGESNG